MFKRLVVGFVAAVILAAGAAMAASPELAEALERKDYTAALTITIELWKRGDSSTPLTFWTPLAEQGEAEAQNVIGAMYEHGLGVPQSYTQALKWYRLAAAQGFADAQVTLGYLYISGRGVPLDYAEGLKWYRLAAAQGDARAQHGLGALFDDGLGVPLDDVEAARWYSLAADQGFARSQFNLGIMYANGEGVPQNNVSAYVWFSLAASASQQELVSVPGLTDEALKLRDAVGEMMTPDQIAEAQRLAREWKPVKPDPP